MRPIRRRGTSLSRLACLLAATAAAACDRAPAVRADDALASTTRAAAQAAYPCGTPIAPDGADAGAELRRGYAEWRDKWVTSRGAGPALRVSAGDLQDDASLSEVVGYGMILAAYFDDRETFDGVWRYAQRHQNADGLMAWKVEADGRAPDSSSATDGDLDIAFALLVADWRWGGYAAQATEYIRRILEHAVEPETFVLKPGNDWGGSVITNPSYFTPAYFKLFRAHTGDERWDRVTETSYRILDRVVERHSARTGLQPDWATAAGDSVTVEAGHPFHYSYNATRVPWRLAMDAAWNCDPRAIRHLRLLNGFFERVGPRDIRDGYSLDGSPLGRWHNAAFVGPAAAAALLSPSPEYRAGIYREAMRLRDSNSYDDSLRLLGLLLATGHMPPPDPSPAARRELLP